MNLTVAFHDFGTPLQMRFKCTESLWNEMPFQTQSSLYHFTVFFINTEKLISLVDTKDLKLKFTKLRCQYDGQSFIIVLRHGVILFPLTSLVIPSWHCNLLKATERKVNSWNTFWSQITVITFMCDL
jgi:hypothetical protein